MAQGRGPTTVPAVNPQQPINSGGANGRGGALGIYTGPSAESLQAALTAAVAAQQAGLNRAVGSPIPGGKTQAQLDADVVAAQNAVTHSPTTRPQSAEDMQAKQEAAEAGLVQQARVKYDPGNARTLELQERLHDSTVAAGRQQADNQLGAGLTQHRIQMAQSGGVGGTGDEGGRGNLLATYYNQLGQAEVQGRAAVGRNQLARAGELGDIEGRIHGQTITDTSGLQRDAAIYDNAASNSTLLNNTVGQSAPTLAQIYANSRKQQAYAG